MKPDPGEQLPFAVNYADWKDKILAHWDLINRLTVRRFGDTSLAEEGALYVISRLEADQWRRVRFFSGTSSFPTFLSSLVFRLLEDFSRKRFGRVRPPAWIQALGGIWLTIFRLLCLQRLSVTEVVETLFPRHPSRERKEIDEIARTVLEKVIDCGKHQVREVEYDEQGEMASSGNNPDESPENRLLADEKALFFNVLFQNLIHGDSGDAINKSLHHILDLNFSLNHGNLQQQYSKWLVQIQNECEQKHFNPEFWSKLYGSGQALAASLHTNAGQVEQAQRKLSLVRDLLAEMKKLLYDADTRTHCRVMRQQMAAFDQP